MKLAAVLRSAVAGWLAGVLALLVLSFAWPSIFPGFVNYKHYVPNGPPPNLVLIVLINMAAASLPAIIGGIVGGQITREGGQRQQWVMAAIFGIILAVPCGCLGLYLFSGY
jgi:hypothetical protein